MNALRMAHIINPGYSPRSIKAKIYFVTCAIQNRKIIQKLQNASHDTSLNKLLQERPELFGILVWPFQSASWDLSTRIDHFVSHCCFLDRFGAPFPFSVTDKIILADIGDYFSGMSLVMDQPRWFMREGQLTLNLFVEDFRAYSVAFSFFEHGPSRVEVFIGGIQGRSSKDATELYRRMTKELHGMRPRDFLFECLRCVARECGAVRILAVDDADRHHRHRYFGSKDVTGCYDEIWRDRGSLRIENGFHVISVEIALREYDSIKPNKRSMYKKRYDMLEDIFGRIHLNFRRANVASFIDR